MRLTVLLMNKGRTELFKRTVNSLRAVDGDIKLIVFSMPDESNCQMEAIRLYSAGLIDTLILESGTFAATDSFYRGAQYAIDLYDPEALLFTADDYEYKPTWYENLSKVLGASASGLSHISMEKEPRFPWANILKCQKVDGVQYFQRETVPSANMAMTISSWYRLKCVYKSCKDFKTGDHRINGWCTEKGLEIGCIDEAEHIGALQSSVGNPSFQIFAQEEKDG